MKNLKDSMISVSALQPISPEQRDELKKQLEMVRKDVVPEIIKDVEARFKNAEQARALFLR